MRHVLDSLTIMGVAELVAPYPAIYIPEIDTLVISDLHLGYEGVMAEEAGLMIPKTQFKKEMNALREIEKRIKARRIVLNGDIKHEFSSTSYHESREVSDMLEYLQQEYEEVIIVKGNHDNFIARITSRYRVKLVEEFLDGRYYFVHGHEIPDGFASKGEVVIIGHEHPAIALYDDVGAKEKIPCILYGDMLDGRKIIVLPAFSILAQGSEVNMIPREELLSPILRQYVDVDSLNVTSVGPDVGCVAFPKLGLLRGIR